MYGFKYESRTTPQMMGMIMLRYEFNSISSASIRKVIMHITDAILAETLPKEIHYSADTGVFSLIGSINEDQQDELETYVLAETGEVYVRKEII